MLVYHFNTYSNGIKTMHKPEPNSSGIPYVSPTLKLFKYHFSQVYFELHSELKFRTKEAQ
jgi:hypothetical protein